MRRLASDGDVDNEEWLKVDPNCEERSRVQVLDWNSAVCHSRRSWCGAKSWLKVCACCVRGRNKLGRDIAWQEPLEVLMEELLGMTVAPQARFLL